MTKNIKLIYVNLTLLVMIKMKYNKNNESEKYIVIFFFH